MKYIEVKKKEGSCGRIIVFKCEQCDKLFEVSYNLSTLENGRRFCTMGCKYVASRKGGILQKEFEQEFGVSNVFAREDVKKKIQDTMLERYGVDNISKSEEIKEKKKNTTLEHYGVNSPFKSPELRECTAQTYFEKYGVRTLYCSQIPQLREKQVATHLERYGYSYSFENPEIRAHAVDSIRERFGVDYAWQSSKVRGKILDSLIANGNIFTSNHELKFYERLKKIFGEENVTHQIKIHKWPIDFYVKSLDAYVQFDGRYWHGLDRPIEIISELKTARDKVILGKMENDKEQNSWFKEHNMKLIRVTDKQEEDLSNDELKSIIVSNVS